MTRARLTAVGRVGPAATVEDARGEIATISRILETGFPRENRGWQAEVVPLRDDLVGPLRRPMLIFLGAAVLVLLIACANVANLLLARGAQRREEIAVRLAIGARRGRIVTQVLAESLVLALAGGALGAAGAVFGVRLLSLALPDGVPSYLHISIDRTVLGFAVISLGTGMLFGIVPALRATRATLGDALRAGGRGGTGGFLRSRLRSSLVSAEVALSLVLVIGATLLIRSDLTLEDEMGFDTRGVVSFRVPLPLAKYEGDRRRAFYEDFFARIRALPGVEAVGSSQGLPFGALGASYERAPVSIEGQPAAPGEESVALKQQISGDYFRALGVRMIRGRAFTAADSRLESARGDCERDVRAAVLSRAGAAWPSHRLGRQSASSDSTGNRQFTRGPAMGHDRRCGDERQAGPSPNPIEPAVFIPFLDASQTLVVRTRLDDPLALVPSVRSVVRQMDPELPTYLIQTLDRMVATALWRQRLQGRVLGLFAMLALLLAVFGIYGVISYAVVQRTRELGVRLALGATRGQVMTLVLGQGARLALAGVVAGGTAALAFTRVLTGLLYEVRPTDPATFIGASVLLGAVAVLAGVIPARRAASVDPIVALRWE